MNKREQNLSKILASLSVKELKDIATLLNQNNIRNQKKELLINQTYHCLTNEKILSSAIKRMIDKEFNILIKIIQNKGIISADILQEEEYYYLCSLGIVFPYQEDKKSYLFMTNDTYEVIKKFNLNKMETIIEENSNIYYLLKAMLELYGVISMSELEELYNEYYNILDEYPFEIPVNPFSFTSRTDRITSIQIENKIYFVNKILTTDYFEDILANIITNQEKIRRKPISEQTLLKYSNYSYYKETNAIKKFKTYLKDKINSPKIDNIIINTINIFKLGPGNLEVAIKLLAEYNLDISEKERPKIIKYLTDIYENCILWQNNGWTTNELQIEQERIKNRKYIPYGIVKIIRGKYKGRFAYYDDTETDDEGEEKAIIYFGSIIYNSTYYSIDYDDMTDEYTFSDLKNRQNEIVRALWKDISSKERIRLIEEKSLIDEVIDSKYQDYIISKKISSKKVFLSHSSLDKETVISVALDLKEHGVDT